MCITLTFDFCFSIYSFQFHLSATRYCIFGIVLNVDKFGDKLEKLYTTQNLIVDNFVRPTLLKNF